MIGIDGNGGAGKTTLAKKIQKENPEYQIHIFHLDDFITPRKVRYNHRYEQWYCYYFLQWQYGPLIEKVLLPLSQGKEVHTSLAFYDKEHDTYFEKQVDIETSDIVIVEGVFLQRKELSEFFDYIIYIDISQEKQLERVVQRDTYIGEKDEILRKYLERYIPAEKYYMDEYQPKDKADEIIKL